MKTHFNPKNNPRVIIIQKLYGKFYNEDNDMEFPKHRFKKFIKDIVFGTIERNDLILACLILRQVMIALPMGFLLSTDISISALVEACDMKSK